MQTRTGSRLAADARLLWAAARPAPDAAEVDDAIAAGADLDTVAWSALANRVGPLYRQALDGAGVLDRLGPVGEALERDANLRRLQEELLLPRALELILVPLDEQALEPVVFKGPSLLDRYGRPGLRPMDDIDVILPARDHERALSALTARGWNTIERPGDHYDTCLVHPDVPHLFMELHWDLETRRERGNGIRAETLWRERHPVTLKGQPAFGLPAELELVALACHAGKPFHHFRRLMWSVDIAVVIAAAGDALDWERTAARARRYRSQTVLAIALHHAARLGANVPEALLRLPAAGARRAALDAVLAPEWPLTDPDDGTIHRLRYAVWDSKTRQADLLLGELTSAEEGGVPRNAVRLAGLAARRWWTDRRR